MAVVLGCPSPDPKPNGCCPQTPVSGFSQSSHLSCPDSALDFTRMIKEKKESDNQPELIENENLEIEQSDISTCKKRKRRQLFQIWMSFNQEICDGSLQNQSGHAGSGIVKITLVFLQYLSDSMDNFPGFGEDEEVTGVAEVNSETRPQSQLPAFSGAFTSAQVRDVFETDIKHDNNSDRDGASTIFEETESIISIGEVMKSSVFSEDESSDNSLWIDLGQILLGSKNAGHPSKHKTASPSPPVWFFGQKNNWRTFPNLSNALVVEI
ncbi:uncharacterized protein Fot_33001 [Forsythia ovata]|uniref:Uncharacterized protein n=1 Tax=Forsythia ovata TaxID=205694 RepID=A0ABD1T9D7_9LAMI